MAGLDVKDVSAPTSFSFQSRTFTMGGMHCAMSFLNVTAAELSDELLKDFLDTDSSQIISMHIHAIDHNRALKMVKQALTEINRSKIEEQKKAVRAGYDMDILPSALVTDGEAAQSLLKELEGNDEHMFLVTFLVLNTGRTKQELENNVFHTTSLALKHHCYLCRLDFQQEQGLASALPLADNQIPIERGLTTSATAVFIPITTQELFPEGATTLYYGVTALSPHLI